MFHHPSEWHYVGEGNRNIVFAYEPPPDPPPDAQGTPSTPRFVLRLRKTSSKIWDTNPPVADQIAFQVKIVRELLGEEYLGSLNPVPLSRPFLEELNASVRGKRPPEREAAAEIDCGQEVGLLLEDHTKFPDPHARPKTISMELKPKWGFLPTSPCISKETAVKKQTCRFCMYKESKARAKAGKSRSRYCPLDLYSDDEGRMAYALEALRACPQNNLKMSYNGVPVDLKTVFGRVLFEPELNPFLVEGHQLYGESELWELVARILKKEKLLRSLRRHQQALDRYDVEKVYEWFQDANEADRRSPDAAEWERAIDRYINGGGGEPADATLNVRQGILEFLISCSLKDCSLILTFREVSEEAGSQGHFSRFTHASRTFEYKMRVLDVDIKPILKIPWYFEKDQNIVR